MIPWGCSEFPLIVSSEGLSSSTTKKMVQSLPLTWVAGCMEQPHQDAIPWNTCQLLYCRVATTQTPQKNPKLATFLMITPLTGWWFQLFFIFTPSPGEMIHFDEHIFQMGWFKHQLVDFWWLKNHFFVHLWRGGQLPHSNLIILWSPLVRFALNIFSSRKFLGNLRHFKKHVLQAYSGNWRWNNIFFKWSLGILLVQLESCNFLAVNDWWVLCVGLMAKILPQIGSVSLVV